MTGRIFVGISFVLAAAVSCSKGEKTGTSDTSGAGPTPASPSVAGQPATPAPGGKVIVVQLVTDEKGNYFEPAEIEAEKGDVIRFTLKVGVHNVHFLTDSNTVKTGLPAASEMLQLPGQTDDVQVSFEPGTYYFQCDPHVALGMKGHLEVED